MVVSAVIAAAHRGKTVECLTLLAIFVLLICRDSAEFAAGCSAVRWLGLLVGLARNIATMVSAPGG
jgi:hypothetical protein